MNLDQLECCEFFADGIVAYVKLWTKFWVDLFSKLNAETLENCVISGGNKNSAREFEILFEQLKDKEGVRWFLRDNGVLAPILSN